MTHVRLIPIRTFPLIEKTVNEFIHQNTELLFKKIPANPNPESIPQESQMIKRNMCLHISKMKLFFIWKI